ncbi:ComF family protein [Rhizobium skierniewicense]|uniref:ComF family protein n=2 Tax=Rhizobium skierniewicense TaxID=984260 RepID=A0A7W6C551_9HYPH|nr:ComF family protein [Rhizobium skierniewicense]MBB3944158.1 ComF family protein [Rhizobium skierniewicense]
MHPWEKPFSSNVGMGALRGLWGAVANFVYPPSCVGCGCKTTSGGALCVECWAGVQFIERPYCEVLGIPFARDHGPGILSAKAIAEPPPFARLRAAAVHDGPARKLVHQLKYLDRTDLARLMASWMLRASDGTVASCDCIVPVPLHRRRFLARRFNQSAELARHLSALSGKPFLSSTLVRIKPTSRQVGLSAKARKQNVRGAFAIAPGREADIIGKRVVLVDDVYTTGATVAAAARRLKKAGASDVTVLTFAMAMSGPI